MHPLTGHTDAVTGVAFSLDDRVLYSASGDRSVRVWDTATGQQIGKTLTGQSNAVVSLALSNNDSVLATGGMDGSIILWDVYGQQRLGVPLYGMFVPVRGIAFNPDGSKLASGGHDNSIILWDTARQQQENPPLVPALAQTGEWVTSLIFHPQQELLYAGSTDGTIRVWDTKLHKENGKPMKLNNQVLSLALSHNNQFLATGDNKHNITIWDLETRGEKTPQLTKHTDAIWTLAFSNDDSILASGSDDMSVRLWDVKSGKSKGDPLPGYSGRVTKIAFGPRNGLLYTACKDEIIRWDIARSPPERRLLYKSEVKDSEISNLDFSPDGSMLVVGIGSTVIFIDPETGKSSFEPADGLTSSIWCVAFDHQGKTVASGSSDGNVTLWNPRTGKRFGRFMEGHHMDVKQMALSSDGRLLAISSSDDRIDIIKQGDDKSRIKPLQMDYPDEKVTALIFNSRLTANQQLFTASNYEGGRIFAWDHLGTIYPTKSLIASKTGYLESLAISPDGATLAAGSTEGGITLWDLSTTPPAKRPLPIDANGATNPVWSLAFSKNGRLLASGSKGEFIIWDVVTGDRLYTYADKGAVPDLLLALQFSPTAPILAVPHNRGDIVLWDISNPKKIWELNSLKGHSGLVSSLSFSPDGKTLASGSYDHTVRLWDTNSGHPLGLGYMQHKDLVNSVVFSRDNKKLYSGGKDGLIMQWDVDIEKLKLNAISAAGRNLTKKEWGKYLPKQKYMKTHPSPLLLEADLLKLKGKQMEAKELFREIVEMTKMSDDSQLLNDICWYGSIDGYADIVMAACDRAVSRASQADVNNSRDTRGVARATANPPRIKEAIEDFQAFAGWTESNPKYTIPGNLRRQWIRELHEGRNPFDEERLRQMRNETMQ
jgi:WD40 repeat protein